MSESSQKFENEIKQALESNDLNQKLNIYNSSDYSSFVSYDLNKNLINSIINTPNISENEIFNFLFNICRDSDFAFASEVLEQKWETLSPSFVKDVIKKSSQVGYNKTIWERIKNKQTELQKQNFDKNKNIMMSGDDIDKKLEYYKSEEFRKNSSAKDKEEFLKSIVDTPGITDTRLRMMMVTDCGSKKEIAIIAKRIDENKIFFSQYLTATFVRFGYYKYVDAELAKRLVMSNPFAKKQVVEIAMDELKANSFDRMRDLGIIFIDVFKIQPNSSLFNDVAMLYSLIDKDKRNPYATNKEELNSKKAQVKEILMNHLEKLYYEYDEEVVKYRLERGEKQETIMKNKEIYNKKYGFKKGEKEEKKEKINSKINNDEIKTEDEAKKETESISSPKLDIMEKSKL